MEKLGLGLLSTNQLVSSTVIEDCAFNLKWLFVISVVLVWFPADSLSFNVLYLFNHVSFDVFGFNCDTP